MTVYSELSAAIGRRDGEAITEWARGLLDGIAAGALATTVVSHPLGFLCVPAHRSGDEGVCLHLWGPQWRRAALTTSPTHCHSWDLVSWVLAGVLRNQTVRLVDEADAPTHQVFEVRSSPDGDVLHPTGRLVRAEVEAVTTHRAGEGYTQRAGVFHQTLVPDPQGLVATVALGLTRPGGTDLSLGGLDTGAHRTRRESCPPEVAAQVVRAARAAIGGTRVAESAGAGE
ncbi:hypothetical protein LZG04_25665 [Saccharothrix sp. S26]|uniref:hypothetical protein n=1 Tax=Saccharothrix sp. S26 TaxID=2907215 RepID=UPI001F2F008A|nr:hypothetical protein [Saccharothrix sp. S26]MCE6998159.1 hypothetical protein [Saccharothrix sp. S26]